MAMTMLAGLATVALNQAITPMPARPSQGRPAIHHVTGLGFELCRTELEAGQYSVVVLGYALNTQYELTVELVETARELRPAAALALGQVGLKPFSPFLTRH